MRTIRAHLPLLVCLFLSAFIFNSCTNNEMDVPDQTEDSLFPTVVTATDGPLPLDKIEYWGYVIQDVPENASPLERAKYEMLVIEPTRTDFSEQESRSFKTGELVTKLKLSAGDNRTNRKFVIAYIDIGQAEDWRWYWKWSVESDWDPAQTPKPADWPSWIITHDPEWVGCFPIAYWHQDWQNIVINGGFIWDSSVVEVSTADSNGGAGYNSILDEVIKDGFDGIYLDWVEAFSDEAVIAAAQTAQIDPVDAMFDFIEAMRQYGRDRFVQMGRDPDEWTIIQQNAPDLAVTTDPRKFTVINAIAEEGVWWEGTGDAGWNDPDGYDVNAKEKLGFDWYNDVRYVWLPAYQQAGIPVFACEYAWMEAEDVYKILALEAGFIPYCTRRSLSRLTTTPPYFY